MASELARAADRGAMCSGREAVAAGLRAEYFGQAGFRGEPLLTRMEGPVDEPWPQAGQGVVRPVRSVRWRGWVKPPMTGRYAFHVDRPGARIVVANQVLASGTGPSAAAASGGGDDSTVALAAGRYHPISVELADVPAPRPGRTPTDALPLRLSWTAPHGARYLVPKAALFPPSDTVQERPAAPRSP